MKVKLVKSGKKKPRGGKAKSPIKSGIAKGCGAVMNDRRKVTKYYQEETWTGFNQKQPN